MKGVLVGWRFGGEAGWFVGGVSATAEFRLLPKTWPWPRRGPALLMRRDLPRASPGPAPGRAASPAPGTSPALPGPGANPLCCATVLLAARYARAVQSQCRPKCAAPGPFSSLLPRLPRLHCCSGRLRAALRAARRCSLPLAAAPGAGRLAAGTGAPRPARSLLAAACCLSLAGWLRRGRPVAARCLSLLRQGVAGWLRARGHGGRPAHCSLLLAASRCSANGWQAGCGHGGTAAGPLREGLTRRCPGHGPVPQCRPSAARASCRGRRRLWP